MSRLNIKSLGITSVAESLEVITFFFVPGEGKRNAKGVINYKKKKEGKNEAAEQYLEIARSVSLIDGTQILTFYLNEEKVATFEFNATSAKFTPLEMWKKKKQWIVIPTDPTYDYIVAESLSGVFDAWLDSDRFEEYLERQAVNLTFNTGFTKAILLYLSYLSHRDKKNELGDTEVAKDGVDLTAVARTYTLMLTKLHNTSDRTKKLFPIQALLSPTPSPSPISSNEVVTEATENIPEEVIIPLEITENTDVVVETEPENSESSVEHTLEVEVSSEEILDPVAKTLDNIAKNAAKSN